MFGIFDIVIIIITGLSAYFGFNTGIIASLFYMSSGFAGMWAAHKYAGELGMNFYLVFMLSAGIVILAGFLLGKLLRGVLLGWMDKAGGVLFGITLGLAIFAVVVYPATKKTSPKWQDRINASFSVRKIMPLMKNLLPAITEFDLQTVKESLPEIKLPEKVSLEIDVPKLQNKTPSKK